MEADGPPMPVDANGNLYTVQSTRISHKFPAVCDEHRVLKVSCNFFTPFGISRQNHVPSHIAFSDLQMILQPFFS